MESEMATLAEERPSPGKDSPKVRSPTRHASFTGSASQEDGSLLSPPYPHKRSADQMIGGSSNETPASRKGRACMACRKLKVKCDSLEKGTAGCSRCQRMGQDCITAKRLRMSLDEAEGREHRALLRLERATEDILGRLKMPPLESYTETSKLVSESVAQTTRENSREPPQQVDQDLAGAPMEGLYEATRLNSLQARLKHGGSTSKNGRRRIESDLISQGLITLDEAEEMFHLFKTSLSRYLFNVTVREDRTLQSVRESSSLLFTAIMVVSSLHIPNKEQVHLLCHKQLRDLVASSMFDRTHTLEDVRGLCIAAFWLPDLSWKLSGHCVRMATELNLHQAFYKAFHSTRSTSGDRVEALERARLWYLLYVLDHHFSIAYGRPPVIAEMPAIRETDLLLQSPECRPSDCRVISQVTLFVILSRAYNEFGLEAERLMGDDEQTLVIHGQFMEELHRWRQTFRHALAIDTHIGDYPALGVDLHFYFASMMLNSLSLRGRPLPLLSSLPAALRPIALNALESAHAILAIVLEEPDIQRSLVGMPLYLHAVIAFAVVFLIKMSSRWRSIGLAIDPETHTRPMIEGVISKLKQCTAGKGHILYNMASGFERLLQRNISGANSVANANVNGHGHGHSNGQEPMDGVSMLVQQQQPPPQPRRRRQTRSRKQQQQQQQQPQPQQQQPALLPPHQPPHQQQQPPPPPPPHQQQQPQHIPSLPSSTCQDGNYIVSPTSTFATTVGPGSATGQVPGDPAAGATGDGRYDPQYEISPTSAAAAAAYGGWRTEDDFIWTMGYDLLNSQPDLNTNMGLLGLSMMYENGNGNHGEDDEDESGGNPNPNLTPNLTPNPNSNRNRNRNRNNGNGNNQQNGGEG